MGIVRQSLAAVLPRRLVLHVRTSNEAKALQRVEQIPCSFDHAAQVDADQVRSAIQAPTVGKEWEVAERLMSDLGVDDQAGGICGGDRRALYTLVRQWAPRTILEIGTHLGFSTLSLALGLKDLPGETGENAQKSLITVDILDVNDVQERPWERFGSSRSPATLMREAGVEEIVRFVHSDSTEFMRCTDRLFDMIFIDGHHGSQFAYLDLVLSSRILETGGVVVVHDYYPPKERRKQGSPDIIGVWLAVLRVCREAKGTSVVPLERLPWQTKPGEFRTSLAVIGCSRTQ